VISTFAKKLALQEKIVQTKIEEGSVQEVAVHCYRLGLQMGTLAGQNLFLLLSPHAQRGIKVSRGGKAGHEKTYGSRRLRLLIVAGLQNEVENLQRNRRGLSLTSVRRIVAKEHKINPRTLLRRTSPFRKKNQ
jgi:hypothetical protein